MRMIRCFGSEPNKMNLSVRISFFFFMVIITQIKFGAGQVTTPWGSTQLAEDFITNFLRIIARGSAFSSKHLDEMSSIRKTLATAMGKFSSGNTSSKIKFQALNMVFASTMAEITAEGGSANIELKIGEIENALNLAYIETMGEVNEQFVDDIKNLIYTLAHTTAIRVSTSAFAKIGDYRQDSPEQQETSTSDKINRINDSILQREPEPGQELPNLESSLAPNASTGDVSTLPFTTRIQRPSLQAPFEQQTKESPINLNTKRNLKDLPGSELQGSSPRVITSVLDQNGSGGYGARIDMSTDTEGSLSSAGPLSSRFEVNGLVKQGPGEYEHFNEEQSNQKIGKIAVGLQGKSQVEGKGSEIQQPSRAVDQEAGGKKAAASFTIDKVEPNRDAKGLIERGSLGYREYQPNDLQSFVAVNQRSEGYGPNYELDAATSVSDRVRSFKSVPNTQEIQGPTNRNTEGSDGYGSKEIGTIVTDSYDSGSESRRSAPEEQKIQEPFRNGQYEREKQGQVPSGQRFNNRESYETEYQETNRLEDEKSDFNLPVTDGKYESGGVASSFEQGLGIRKTSKVGNLTSNSGLNDGEHRTAATVARAMIGYESTNDTKELHGFINNGPKSDGRDSYASGFAAAVSGFNADRPIRSSKISNPDDNSEISPIAPSLVPGIPIKSPAVTNSSAPQVSIANTTLSDCNVLIQTLLDIVSTLVHLLGSCKIGQMDRSDDVASTRYASMTGQFASKPIS